jgi:ABC-type nickel/cobalt efflux system permease component RcnA
MRRAFLILGAVLALFFAVFWLTGGVGVLEHWVVGAQREVQSSLAAAVRAIKTGQPGALALLLSVCFGYGVLHAVGPGHGKVLIGGYGMGRRVPFWSLSGLSLAASLAQSAVAVAFVYAGVAVLGWTRDAAQGVAEQVMVPVGTAAIGLVGLWLMLRGLRGIWRQQAAGQGHDHAHHHHDHHHSDHHHHHDHDEDCSCGHAHGPTIAEVEKITGWRDAVALVAGVALRPCTGALFLLILTWQVGIGLAGIAGTFAMGLGTAVVTVGVAAMAVWAREGALASLPVGQVGKALPWFEAVAGALVALIALSLLMHNFQAV